MTYGSETPNFVVFQWPPPPTCKVFNLAMILSPETIRRKPLDEDTVRLTLRGNVDDIMEKKSSIELEDLFKCYHVGPRKRKVILIEGDPGAGKSTLAWDICQRWELRELFLQEFKVVIYVQFRDPEVQSAKEIADLLPMEFDSERKCAASLIRHCHGKGVLFVLDGWDEYSPGLQRGSLFEKLICHPSRLSVQLSTVVITSRPITSGKLQPYATSRVEIMGFTSDEVCRYFEDVFNDTVIVQKLYDQLEDRPMIKASCCLPLNAAIVAHLFTELNHTLPTTLHGVFTSVTLSCIIRHITKQSESDPKITSLDDLPPDIEEIFQKLCILAYEGAMSNKVIFAGQDLRSYGLPEDLNVLSLMQVVQSFATGKPMSYHFLHLSIQELLTALHISKQPPAEQVRIFRKLFGQPRFASVFCFYAAFTKLQVEGIRNFIVRVIQSSQMSLLLNLMHCLFEAQDVSLCYFVSSQLAEKLEFSATTTLSPFDLLCLKYFLSCTNNSTPGPAVSRDGHFCHVALSELSLCQCQLTPEGIDSLSLCNLVKVRLDFNTVSCTCIARLLANNSQLKVIQLQMCTITFDSDGVLSTALKEHCSLQELNIPDVYDMYSLTQSTPFLHEVLQGICTHRSVKYLNLRGLCPNMEELGAVLEVNTTLQILWIGWEELTDRDLAIFASSVKKNKSLQELRVGYNLHGIAIGKQCQITEGGVHELMCSLRNCHLRTIAANGVIASFLSQQRDQVNVNKARRDQGLPPLEIIELQEYKKYIS